MIVVAAGALAVGALGTVSYIVGYSRVFGRIFVALAEVLVVLLALGSGPYAFSTFCVLGPGPYKFSIAAFLAVLAFLAIFAILAIIVGTAFFGAEGMEVITDATISLADCLSSFNFAEFQADASAAFVFAAFAGFAEFHASVGFQAFIGFHADTSAALFAFAFFAAFIAFMIALLGVMFLDCNSLESSSVESVDAASAPMERRSNLLFML